MDEIHFVSVWCVPAHGQWHVRLISFVLWISINCKYSGFLIIIYLFIVQQFKCFDRQFVDEQAELRGELLLTGCFFGNLSEINEHKWHFFKKLNDQFEKSVGKIAIKIPIETLFLYYQTICLMIKSCLKWYWWVETLILARSKWARWRRVNQDYGFYRW